MIDRVSASLGEARQMLASLIENEQILSRIVRASDIFANCLANGGTVFSCGNGGSMCDAMHFAEELSGRYRNDRKALSAIAVSDPGHISCVSNDFGYGHVFSRFLEAHARPGDCLLAISTSGTSGNVLKAARHGRRNGLQVVSLTGSGKSEIGLEADLDICVGPAPFADRVQELHIKVIHILIELIEYQLFSAEA